jgi:ribosome-binding protein aMBF1 (putative translation factor)
MSEPATLKVMASVGMLAGVNGALVQIVMASRVDYGMSKRDLAARVFSKIHRLRQVLRHRPRTATLT